MPPRRFLPRPRGGLPRAPAGVRRVAPDRMRGNLNLPPGVTITEAQAEVRRLVMERAALLRRRAPIRPSDVSSLNNRIVATAIISRAMGHRPNFLSIPTAFRDDSLSIDEMTNNWIFSLTESLDRQQRDAYYAGAQEQLNAPYDAAVQARFPNYVPAHLNPFIQNNIARVGLLSRLANRIMTSGRR